MRRIHDEHTDIGRRYFAKLPGSKRVRDVIVIEKTKGTVVLEVLDAVGLSSFGIMVPNERVRFCTEDIEYIEELPVEKSDPFEAVIMDDCDQASEPARETMTISDMYRDAEMQVRKELAEQWVKERDELVKHLEKMITEGLTAFYAEQRKNQ